MSPEGNQPNSAAQNRKKRLLFVITQSEFGGAQRFLFNFLSRLDYTKYEITVAVGADGNGELNQALKQKGVLVWPLNNLRRQASLWRDFKAQKELKRAIAQIQPDVLFLMSSKAGFIGSWAARQLVAKTEVIYRIGGWAFNDPWPWWKRGFFFFLEWLSAGWKDCIIVNSKYDFDQAKKLKIKPRKAIKLIPNGLDVYKMDFLSKDDAKLKLLQKISTKENELQSKIIIGTIANYYPTKGLSYLIEAAEDFKNEKGVIFIVIGDGEERPKLERLIIKKGLEEKVFLVGQMPNAYQYLTAFDVFVLTSVKEGFPWALIEAMAAKLPVVATQVGAIPEIIQTGKNGLIVPPRDPKKTAEAIKTALKSSKLTSELGIQAHQTVLFKYGLDKMVSQIEELF